MTLKLSCSTRTSKGSTSFIRHLHCLTLDAWSLPQSVCEEKKYLKNQQTKRVDNARQARDTATETWITHGNSMCHTSKYKVYKLHQSYIPPPPKKEYIYATIPGTLCDSGVYRHKTESIFDSREKMWISVSVRPAGCVRMWQKLSRSDFLRQCKCDKCQTSHGGSTYWALPINTIFSDLDCSSRSQ